MQCAHVPFDRLTATLALDAPVSTLAHISEKRARDLGSMGIVSIRDLLTTYPRRYIDNSLVVLISQVQQGRACTVIGTIYEIRQRRPRPRLSLLEITLTDDTGSLLVTVFNQPWLTKQLSQGARVSVSGTVEFNYGFYRMTNPVITLLDPDEVGSGLIIPIYPATARISTKQMASFIKTALKAIKGCYDSLPVDLRTKYILSSQYQALQGVHAPKSMEDVVQARRRLIYEELFIVELTLLEQARERNKRSTPFAQPLPLDAEMRLREILPFDLSDEQNDAVTDITMRMAQEDPLNHLLLGDVGTGKTAVALFAIVASALSGNQVAMMGPTEVLVRQYAYSIGSYLTQMGITWAILSGSTSFEERSKILKKLKDGSLSVVLGTHALLEPEIMFARAGLVVIDEQQRFGVEQRAALLAKAPGADFLSLTATPIPRSLALALYGDQTLSYLHVKPVQSAPRTTKVFHFSDIGYAYDAVREALERGEQAYIVCPLIGVSTESLDQNTDSTQQDASKQTKPLSVNQANQTEQTNQQETEELRYAQLEWELEHDKLHASLSAAAQHARILQESVFPEAHVGLLHGKLSSDEKRRVMDDFKAGEINILVSTTVIEVGVDVPNATVMIIEDADRFGLAQLHQLRGRVGRGSKPGQVFAISRSRVPAALERLHALEQTDDGFVLSEYDLSLRKEGDIFGDRQSGRAVLKLVNVMRDAAIIEAAHADAQALLERAKTDVEAAQVVHLAKQGSLVRLAPLSRTSPLGGQE